MTLKTLETELGHVDGFDGFAGYKMGRTFLA